jgi:outer membrane protein assembly factor BamB
MALRTRALVLVAAVLGGALVWVLLGARGGDARAPARPVGALALPARWREVSPPARKVPWPQFGGDALHSGATRVVGPQRGHVRWRRRLEGPVVPGPAVASGDVVYAASNGGVLHAIDLSTGRDRWRFDGHGAYGSDLSTAPTVLRDGLVLWPGPRDTLYALGPDGRLRWRLRLAAMPLSPAVAGRHDVVVSDQSGWVRALELRDGAPRVRWRVRAGTLSYASPAVAPDGTVYVTADRDLVAIRNGHVAWRYAAGALSEVSPAVAGDGTVIFGSNDEHEYGVDSSGRLRWRYRIGALTYSSPVATPGGLIYFGDHHGVVSALDLEGRLVARVAGLQPTARLRSVGVWTAPLVDGRHDVYFGTRPGHVYGFAPTGRRLFDLDTGATVDSYPALARDGTLLIGSESGWLYAVR